MYVKFRFSFLAALLFTFSLSAQEIRIQSGFVEDSMEIGQQVHYWITANYPPYLEVIFPDSLSSFSPFEYQSKYFLPTSETNGILFDTAVYQLQSFEIDSYQSLQLQVVVLELEDSLTLQSPLDSIAFKELVPIITDSTSLLTNSQYLDVPLAFNYPMLWIIIGILLFISILVLVLFGKKIRTAFKIRRLKKEYVRFNERLTQYIRDLKANPETTLAEHAVVEWKVFMEKLEKQPYTKLTTAEILQNSSNQELKEELKHIDRMIYGGMASDNIYKSFQSIEDFTQHRYQLRINELKDGKSN